MYSKCDHSFENPTYQPRTCTGKPNRWSTVDPCCIASTLTSPKIYLAKSELFKFGVGIAECHFFLQELSRFPFA